MSLITIIDKETLIEQIIDAFAAVKLEDGIGLWEGQALDDHVQNTTEYKRLKDKDERNDWRRIPIADLYKCSSSISFMDAKGIRFHLGLYLLFAMDVFEDEEDRLHKHPNFKFSPPEVVFALDSSLDAEYSIARFSLLTREQITCVVEFLMYRLQELESCAQDSSHGMYQRSYDRQHQSLTSAITIWQEKRVAI
ncbi:DUF6714 family protein [uncultured Croceitalea sp.]|uniref:DUF6714 family protein n=1 Tax=uncultured Croceitalea sp. TaxID=1798908 RepID=UPI003305D2F3